MAAVTTEQVKVLLRTFLCSEDDVNIWLHRPHPDLGNRTPQSVIDDGMGQAIFVLVENAMDGQPS